CRRAIALVHLREIDALGVLLLVLVGGEIAPVVVTLADQPGEDARRVRGIRDPAVLRAPVPAGDVVARDGSPEAVLRHRDISPPFDAGKQTLGARAIAVDAVRHPVDDPWRDDLTHPRPTSRLDQNRDEIL